MRCHNEGRSGGSLPSRGFDKATRMSACHNRPCRAMAITAPGSCPASTALLNTGTIRPRKIGHAYPLVTALKPVRRLRQGQPGCSRGTIGVSPPASTFVSQMGCHCSTVVSVTRRHQPSRAARCRPGLQKPRMRLLPRPPRPLRTGLGIAASVCLRSAPPLPRKRLPCPDRLFLSLPSIPRRLPGHRPLVPRRCRRLGPLRVTRLSAARWS